MDKVRLRVAARALAALAAGAAALATVGGDAYARQAGHRAKGPHMVSARLYAPDAHGAPTRLRLAFNRRVSFAGTARGARFLAVAGYRVARIGSASNAPYLVVRVRRHARAAARTGRVRLLRRRHGPWIHDRAGRHAVPGSIPFGRESRLKSGTRSGDGSSTSTSSGSGTSATGPWHTLSNPIDPAQQTWLPWETRSHWLQPWRAYLDTQPASMLRDSVGINFNVPASAADVAASLLAGSGFRRARIEIPWGAMSYDDPTQFEDRASVDARLAALKAHGIRPLILLNANDGDPGPTRFFDARVITPAAAGDRSVQVDQATAAALVPGLSGFNGPTGTAAQLLVTSISPGGWVQLSQPLPAAMPAGVYRAAVLRYQPFAAPFTSSGSPNPLFEQTLSGWLQYVGAVTSEAKRVLGDDNFDVEVWNELTFGSNFLIPAAYYNPVPAGFQGIGDPTRQILVRTIAYLRDPSHGVPDVGIGNGFANQTPFPSGATSPVGLTAIDKHPYRAMRSFPADSNYDQNRPVNALGQLEGTQDSSGAWHDSFTPTYRALFPEYFLSAIQTEFMERDLSPITTTIGGVPHGRFTAPSGGTPPKLWITETNVIPPGDGSMTAADKRHLQAKATLRALSAFVNKGVSALYFYAVNDGDWSMVDPTKADGGETMAALKRFTQSFAGPATIGTQRSLTLSAVADQANHVQFQGDGTAAHPPLYNRDVLAFFPFQADTNKFVVPAYVMTRDMAKVYNTSAPTTDVTRYDLPPESYQLTVGGVNAAALQASATDPLTGQSVPVTIVSRSGDSAVLQVDLTDYPRLLVLQDG